MKLDLDQLRKLCEKATEPPWLLDIADESGFHISRHYFGTIAEWFPCEREGDERHEQILANGRLIVSARTALPELVAEVETLRGFSHVGTVDEGLVKKVAALEGDLEKAKKSIEGLVTECDGLRAWVNDAIADRDDARARLAENKGVLDHILLDACTNLEKQCRSQMSQIADLEEKLVAFEKRS